MFTEPLFICEKTKSFAPHLPQRETDQVLEASGACFSGCWKPKRLPVITHLQLSSKPSFICTQILPRHFTVLSIEGLIEPELPHVQSQREHGSFREKQNRANKGTIQI